MGIDPSELMIAATKPGGRAAQMLAEAGIGIVPLGDEEGDVDRYVLSPRVAIERRTADRFLRGIEDRTLFTSAIYLREHFAVPVLLVEGDPNLVCRSFSPGAVRGALSSMALQYGLTVLSTPDLEETVQLIVTMARQEQVGIPEISLIPKRKATDLADMQRRVVEMLPGCGMVMARELLHHFGSVREIVNATEGELRACRGVGAGTARQIGEVVGAEYRSVDTERNLEDAVAESPGLLFASPVSLLARQHHIYTDERERHIVDLVFVDERARELILVELKRGKLIAAHLDQIRRYLRHARECPLLRERLDEGMTLRGVLATVDDSATEGDDEGVSLRTVPREGVMDVLAQLRARRLAATRQ